ncbi:hypothetical protein Tco_0695923, partial [Tanacetum coccineum]
ILPHHSYPSAPLAFITLRSSHHQILPHRSPPPSPPPSSPLTAIVNCVKGVERIARRDITEVEAEQKMLQEAISNAREREKRSLL